MPKSRAEIQREYRRRRDADSSRREVYLKQEKIKYQKDLSAGKRKHISDMSDREVRRQRRDWKKRQRRSRLRRGEQLQYTPPRTPEESLAPGSHESRQRQRGRQRMRRENKAAYKRIAELELELAAAKKNAEKYKKRHQRLLVRPSAVHPETPRTKTKRLLANFHRYKTEVKKTLTYHYALVDTIKSRYKESTEERQKQAFSRMVTGRIIRRYRLESFSREQLGFSTRRWMKLNSHLTAEHIFRTKRQSRRNCELRDVLLNFYIRDDVSRMTSGKRETITRKKCKMQKRLLVDTLLNTHLKFCSEFAQFRVSYSLFCQLRPFWVVPPTSQDRQTCLCKTHNNLELIIDKLVELKVLPRAYSVDTLCDSVACDSNEKRCMYGECPRCASRAVDFCCEYVSSADDLCNCTSSVPKMRHFQNDKTVSYYAWQNKMIEKDGKKTTIVVKQLETVELSELIWRFNDMLLKGRRHVFNIRQQFLAYRSLRKSLDEKSCLIHIDFSENYQCQYHAEVQAVHFGGSHQQVTLHTGVLYVSQNEPVTFCTLSDCHRKDPVAIWTHLDPVLKNLRNEFPNVNCVHFFSDGPTTQYRQKKNFHLFSTKLFTYGFERGTWNFFEAAHGKGAADGVGAVLKRTADRLVNQGLDLPTPLEMFNRLCGETSIKLYYVSEEAVNAFIATVPPSLPALPGTMSVHQLYVHNSKPASVMFRDISCFCSVTHDLCNCFEVKTFDFPLLMDTVNSVPCSDDGAGVGNSEITATITAPAVAVCDSETAHAQVEAQAEDVILPEPAPGTEIVLQVERIGATVRVINDLGETSGSGELTCGDLLVNDAPEELIGPAQILASTASDQGIQSTIVTASDVSEVSPATSPLRVRAVDISPLPSCARTQERKRKSQAAELITGSPYKKMLQIKQTDSSSAQQNRKNKSKKNALKVAEVGNKKKTKRNGKGRVPKQVDTTPCGTCCIKYCDDKISRSWIQCQQCNIWYHNECQGLPERGPKTFECIDCEND